MPLPNGLYKIAFRSASGTDYGVAYMQDGKLRGGDSGMAYVGSYEQDGDLLTMQLSVTQHRAVAGGIGPCPIDQLPPAQDRPATVAAFRSTT